MIWGLQDLPYEEILKTANLMSLEIRCYIADLLEFYHIVHSLDKLEPEALFDMAQNSLRARAQLHHKEAKTQPDFMKIYAFSQRVVYHWNKLSIAAVNANIINVFKSHIDPNKCIQEPY